MTLPIILLIPVAFVISLALTLVLIRLGRRLGAMDSEGSEGHVKAEIRDVPNGFEVRDGTHYETLFVLRAKLRAWTPPAGAHVVS